MHEGPGTRGDFLHTKLGATGLPVFRLGLSGTHRPGVAALRAGIDAGINYLFWFTWDSHMTQALREVLPHRREQIVVATGATNLLGTRVLEKALGHLLRKLRTDYIDIFHCFWVPRGRFDPRTRDILMRFKSEGRIRHFAISTHARQYAGSLVARGELDVLMMRYNAAHRGAEEDIFPYLAAHNPQGGQPYRPGLVSYTATCWKKLLVRPGGWPEDGAVPRAGDCYRFVLSNPHVHVCLSAPSDRQQLEENLREVAKGPLDGEELAFMRRFGDAVRGRSR